MVTLSEKSQAIAVLSSRLNEELARADELNQKAIRIHEEYMEVLKQISSEQQQIIERSSALEESIKKIIVS